MLFISFITKKNRFLNKMESKRKHPNKYNSNVFITLNMTYLLIFLILNTSYCYGWFSDPTTSVRSLVNMKENNVMDRHPRYAEFDPPIILPANDFQTVKANTTYNVRCKGSRGVSWRIPETASSDLRSRIFISHHEPDQQTRRNGNSRNPTRRKFGNNVKQGINGYGRNQDQPQEKTYVAVLKIAQLKYSDTGTFTCTYNGTTDLKSIDNSTSVHLYVDDRNHLLRTTSSFDFLHAVQSQTLVLPCMPTHPDVNVTLWREGTRGLERVLMSQYISFDPKVRPYID